MGRSRWTLVAMSLGFAVVQLDVSVVNVAIRPIGSDLGGGIAALQWIVSAYTIAFAAFILSAGALGDRIGARRVFVAGFALFTGASAACGLAPGLGALIAAFGWRAIFFINVPIGAAGIWLTLRHARETPRASGRGIDLPGQAAAVLALATLAAATIEGGRTGWRWG
jgi:MFS transporter, DHA2 family, methylenomycin A resistance protein